jgi:hypothetical protein
MPFMPESKKRKALMRKERTAPAPLGHEYQISDNPFDILSHVLYRPVKRARPEAQAPKPSPLVEDEIFTRVLVRSSREEAGRTERKVPHGIFRSMLLYSKAEIDVEPRQAYKFPFDLETKNDGSALFRSLYEEYLVAIRSVFNAYKRGSLSFHLKVGSNHLHFHDRLRATGGMRKALATNDIGFTEDGKFLVVEGPEVALVFDYITNIPLTGAFAIPFILASAPFHNSILYEIRLEKGSVVKEGGELLFSYRLRGPLWIGDFMELTEHEYMLNP